MNFNDQVAREIIKERTQHKDATRRPTHPRAARMLRRLADKADGNTR